MRLLIVLFALWSLALAAQCPAPSEAAKPAPLPERYRFVFVVDTSGSMMGLGDGKAVIFPKVKAELLRFVGNLPAGSELILVPFHQGPQGRVRFRLPEERARAEAYIRSLEAKGQNTWIYRTLVQLLDSLNPEPGLATVYYIFTDGIDNDRTGPYRMRDVVARLRLKQGPYDWVYYTALGVEVPPEVVQGLGSLPRTRVTRAAVGQVPALGAYTFKPIVLQLGNLYLKPEAEAKVLLEAQGNPGSLRIRVEDQDLQAHGAFLTLSPTLLRAGEHTLRFRLEGGGLPQGDHTAWLCLEAPEGSLVRPERVKVLFAFHPPALYRLVPQQVPESLRLGVGERGEAVYRLEGNDWAREPVTLSVEGPEGLVAQVNGAPTAQVAPGEEVRVSLENRGLGAGEEAAPAFRVQVPEGAQLGPLPPLPSATQPLTLWDRLLRYWWLLLPFLFLLPFLLQQMIQALRPWGALSYEDPQCEKHALSLKGARVDLGNLTNQEPLKGVILEREGQKVRLARLPLGVKAKMEGYRLEEGETLSKGDEVAFYDDQGNSLGSIQINRMG
jgi:hypothetical protein